MSEVRGKLKLEDADVEVVDVEEKMKNGRRTSMQCLSCKKHLYYRSRYGPGSCKECYVAAIDRAVELERENKKLKANVDFLRLSSPSSHDDHPRSSPLFSNVKLVASDDSPNSPILANKFVLASRSSVFIAMLETKLKESISGMIKISDVTFDSLRAFVDYLYTAEVCLDKQIACDLLVLGEKYQVKHLKEHCESYLLSNLNLDNSVSNYVFSHQYGAKKLLEASLTVMTDNMDKFINTDEYRELVKKDASFVVGIFEALAKRGNTAAKK
ncbi:hypothetical protein Dimus_024199 [Dionaea muscipula]